MCLAFGSMKVEQEMGKFDGYIKDQYQVEDFSVSKQIIKEKES